MASAMSRGREQYVRLLREHLLASSDVSLSTGILAHTPRRKLASALSESRLTLPEDWAASASRALQLACADIIPSSTFQETDYFLCSLIHPTYISPQTVSSPSATAVASLRQHIATPGELIMSGSTALRVIEQTLALHTSSETNEEATRTRVRQLSSSPPSITVRALNRTTLEKIPLVAGLQPWLLYNRKAFRATSGEDVSPEEVLLATTTALCGAIELTHGIDSVARFVDRMAQRVHSS